MNKKNQITALLLLLSFWYIDGSITISGNSDVPGQTFLFSIGQTLMSPMNNFYTAALNGSGGSNIVNNFSIARLNNFALSNQGTKSFTPLAPERVTIEEAQDQPNPLFDQGIALTLLTSSDGWFDNREFPIAVAENNPSTIYLINMQPNNTIQLMTAKNINDANGSLSSGVIAMATNVTSNVFAAVKPANGLFGDDNSGIAMVIKGFVAAEQGDVKGNVDVFHQVNAATGKVVDIPQAVALDKKSSVVAIGSELAAMQNFATLTWSPSLQRLFIGLQVTAQNGARGVVVGKLVDGGLQLQTIAPDEAFAPGNQQSIIGVNGAGLDISVNFIKTLYMSTALQYLIVAGGNQSSTQATQTVYALPIVNSGEKTGSIADKNVQPQDVFGADDVHHIIARIITKEAQNPESIPQATDAAAAVGGGAFTAGEITDMVVRDDTVFIFVGNETVQGAAGIYYSQALFEASGKIKGWTNWQRTSGIADHTFFGSLNSSDGSFIAAIGQDKEHVSTVKKTVWSAGDPQGLLPVSEVVDMALTPQTGGVQSMYTFLPSTPGLNAISLLAFGGSENLVLAQTGTLNTVLLPTTATEYFPTQVFENGIITHDSTGSKTIVISGGALNDVGPITAIEIVQAAQQGWLFVGGINGVAVLTHENGSGWNTTAGQLGDGFNGITTGMRFIKIGNYTFVKKLIADGTFLYVVTDTLVDRIDLAQSDFENNIIFATSVATQQGLAELTQTGSIVDALISGPFALLATTGGLVRVGNDKAINKAMHEQEIDWTFVAMPEAAGAPVQIRAATKTGRSQDVARYNGGHLYVLNSSNGFDQSRINRFAVQPTTTGFVTADTLTQFNDLYVQNIPSFFLSFGQFKNNFITDGALYFTARGAINNQIATVTLTPPFPEPRVGVSQVGEKSTVQDIIFTNTTELNAFEKSQASGSWIIAGTLGTNVLE